MVPAYVHTLSRAALTAAIQAADLDIPPDAYGPVRIPFTDDTCLAYTPDQVSDLLSFAQVVTGLIPEIDRPDFAGCAVETGWHGRTVTFPGYHIDGPTPQEWDDAHNEDADRDEIRAAVDEIVDQATAEDALAGTR